MSIATQLGKKFKSEFSGQLIATIAGTGLTLILARLLDPSGYGILFYSISIFSIVKVFSNLGIPKSAARYIAENKDSSPELIPTILRTSISYNVLIILFVSVSFYFIHPFVAEVSSEPNSKELLKVGTLYIVFSSTSFSARIIAQGFEDIKLSAVINVTKRVSQLILVVGFVLLGYGIIGALWGFIIGFCLATLVGFCVIYHRYYLNSGRPEISNLPQNISRKILEYSIPLSITNMSGKLDSKVDTILVGILMNPVSVSYYVIGKQVISVSQMPASALGFSISPTYGKNKEEGNQSTSAKIFEKSLIYTLLIYLPCAAGLFLISSPTISLIFGPEYHGAVPVLQTFSAYLILQSITQITDNPLDYLGRARERAIAKGISSVSNVVLNLFLIPWIGVVGAAIATVITHTFYNLVKLYIVYSELPVEVSRIVAPIGKIILITGAMSIVVGYLAQDVHSMITLAFIIAIGILVWGVMSIITGAIDTSLVRESLG
ncbi:Membrane protein involved in the export of O-antigen and teichoic acid [Halogranum amylolyticum]|uniref:Membrane protein involved in the export of O-antigen and teichoic acid n=1 Tax=Halogranum amylolyticum TaxID=660520 RepID=A0A1H8WVN7_9EURY|nr:flippase [Halogranum amylolyticum]SEP31760.1 Membrane protein involved in the export of O-antigen and teichoic acid [Halogranum amylolyticum]